MGGPDHNYSSFFQNSAEMSSDPSEKVKLGGEIHLKENVSLYLPFTFCESGVGSHPVNLPYHFQNQPPPHSHKSESGGEPH